jgi:hypothetical protein
MGGGSARGEGGTRIDLVFVCCSRYFRTTRPPRSTSSFRPSPLSLPFPHPFPRDSAFLSSKGDFLGEASFVLNRRGPRSVTAICSYVVPF